MYFNRSYGPRLITFIFCAAVLLLGACAQVANTDPQDPNESVNRGVHKFNKGVDSAILRPASKAYGTVVPPPVSQSVRNFGENLSTPSNAINKLLQGKLRDSGTEVLRFGINSTLGLAGLFDPATELGIDQKATDFGQTLHTWGADQGSYVELPLIGPSTERDTVGLVIDGLINPVSLIQNNEIAKAQTSSRIGNTLRTRSELGGTIDGVLYESVDSYNQAKILYLARRNAQLNNGPSEDSVDEGSQSELEDEYEDFYE